MATLVAEGVGPVTDKVEDFMAQLSALNKK